jgi:hemoglobin
MNSATAHFIDRARRIAQSPELGIAGASGVMLSRGERLHRANLDTPETPWAA